MVIIDNVNYARQALLLPIWSGKNFRFPGGRVKRLGLEHFKASRNQTTRNCDRQHEINPP
jgi:hypothetical protein